MRLIIVGCEYAGKTTLLKELKKWWKDVTGATLFAHDHFTFPGGGNGAGKAEIPEDELERLRALGPVAREMFQRYVITYHLQTSFMREEDLVLVGFHIEEAVYAPLYYGYGRFGEYAERTREARSVELEMMTHRPDTVLVLLRASPETIIERMKKNHHKNGVVKEEDVKFVLRRFDEEYESSLMRRKFILDTTELTIDETLRQFIKSMEAYFSPIDILRMIQHKTL